MLLLRFLASPGRVSDAERVRLARPFIGLWFSSRMARYVAGGILVVGAAGAGAGTARGGAAAAFLVAWTAGLVAATYLVGAGVMSRRPGLWLETAWLARQVPGWISIGLLFGGVATALAG